MTAAELQSRTAHRSPADERNSLLHAFEKFQEHCERLETVHSELRRKLARAETRLEEKNRELAGRMHEINVMKGRLAAILESIPDALLVVDADGRVELANPAAKQLFGQPVSEGRSATSVPELTALVSAHEHVRDLDVIVRSHDRKATLMATASPLVGADGKHGTRIFVMRDVTEYRHLQERLAREGRLAALGQVAASVAHEIRNPLGAIEGFGRLLEQDLKDDNPDALRLLSRMVYAGRQMNRIVGNLLNYAREAPPQLLHADLIPLVREVLDMMELKARESNISMQLNLQDAEPAACLLDPVRIKEVVTNLIANAIQACHPRAGGRVQLTVRRLRFEVELVVADTGRGIPEDALQKIFDPFYTLKQDGIGLGLALCKRIVEEHDGSIRAANLPEGGAEFSLRIPAVKTDDNRGRTSAETKRAAND
jgi:PAS domain S-box-containing protein